MSFFPYLLITTQINFRLNKGKDYFIFQINEKKEEKKGKLINS